MGKWFIVYIVDPCNRLVASSNLVGEQLVVLLPFTSVLPLCLYGVETSDPIFIPRLICHYWWPHQFMRRTWRLNGTLNHVWNVELLFICRQKNKI